MAMQTVGWRCWALLAPLLVVTAGSVAATPAAEAEAFYSIPGPDGQMIVVRRPVSPAKPAMPAAAPASRPAPVRSPVPVATPTGPRAAAPVAAPASPVTSPQQTAATAVDSPAPAPSPIQEVGGERYVDSEYLEHREFNLEGRKRFYPVVDGQGRVQVIERESGISLSRLLGRTPQAAVAEPVLSPRYRVLPAAEVEQLLGQRCLPDGRLSRLSRVTDTRAYRGFIRPSADEQDLTLLGLDTQAPWLALQSFTQYEQQPAFYWPLAVFLDQNRCILEGAAGFFQQKLPATVLQHSGLSGVLRRPAQARYLVLTPLAEAAELDGLRLVRQGQVQIQAIQPAP